MPSYLSGRATPGRYGLKAIWITPGNAAAGLDTAPGRGAALQRRDRRAGRGAERVGGDRNPDRGRLGGRDQLLARPDADVLAVIGAGRPGPGAHVALTGPAAGRDPGRGPGSWQGGALRRQPRPRRRSGAGVRGVAGGGRRGGHHRDRDQLGRAGAAPRVAGAGHAHERRRRLPPHARELDTAAMGPACCSPTGASRCWPSPVTTCWPRPRARPGPSRSGPSSARC